MSARFAELDWQQTPMGEISLRRRRDPASGVEIYEARLDDDFLMSSLFTVAEKELARLGLAEVEGEALDVVVGGLGLGYTAREVLEDSRVNTVTVVEALPEVIGWHQRGLLPVAGELTADPRCRLLQGDFFGLVGAGLASLQPDGWSAILVDIDHTPRHHLHPGHADFYTVEGLRRLAGNLRPGGVFGLWSDDEPDLEFGALLDQVFTGSTAHIVAFDNPLTEGTSANTVYVATR